MTIGQNVLAFEKNFWTGLELFFTSSVLSPTSVHSSHFMGCINCMSMGNGYMGNLYILDNCFCHKSISLCWYAFFVFLLLLFPINSRLPKTVSTLTLQAGTILWLTQGAWWQGHPWVCVCSLMSPMESRQQWRFQTWATALKSSYSAVKSRSQIFQIIYSVSVSVPRLLPHHSFTRNVDKKLRSISHSYLFKTVMLQGAFGELCLGM